MRITVLLVACSALLFSCQGKTSREESPAPEAIRLITTLEDLLPAFTGMDSVSIMLYKNPFGNDGERYTRYYTQLNTADSGIVNLVKTATRASFTKQDTLRGCRSEGKIHVFRDGQVFQTLYFASQPKGCSHIYIIHEGFYYYLPMESTFAAAIPEWKKKSVSLP